MMSNDALRVARGKTWTQPLSCVAVAGLAVLIGCGAQALAQTGPDPLFEKPAPLTMESLAKLNVNGVAAVEVSDYAYPGYTLGKFYSDLKPQKAVIMRWETSPAQFVFAHEASYCPLMMTQKGVGLCNQFFESNFGWGELFNDSGRKERNSFVDIVQSNPRRAWVRWTYFCVNSKDDSRPCIRGTEDYIAFPNGLVWRRLTYESLMPDKPDGHSLQPIDFFSTNPPRSDWSTFFRKDDANGDYNVATVLDAASDKRYEMYWAARPPTTKPVRGSGTARRVGDDDVLQAIARSPLGFAMVLPVKDGPMPFIVIGSASGFEREKSQLVDHSAQHRDTGGNGWGAIEVDHWPIGWINSQCHTRELNSPYPYHICQMSHYIVNSPILSKQDYMANSKNMDLNRWMERHVFYAMHGVGKDFESIRKLARQWLEKGADCAKPESVEGLTNTLN